METTIPEYERCAAEAAAGRALEALGRGIRPRPQTLREVHFKADRNEVGALVEAGVLEALQSGEYVFLDDEAFRGGAEGYVANRLQATWEDAEGLAEALRLIELAEFGPDALKGTRVRALFRLQRQGVDIDARLLALAGDESGAFSRLLGPVMAALPELEYDADRVERLLIALLSDEEGRKRSGHLFGALKGLASRDRTVGEALLDRWVVAPEAEVAKFTPHVLAGLATHDLGWTLRRALDLTGEPDELLVRHGIYALALLPASPEVEGATLERLRVIEAEQPALQGALAGAYVQMAYDRPALVNPAGEAISRLALSADPEVYFHAARYLTGHHEDYTQTWWRSTLIALARVGTAHGGILMEIEAALSWIVPLEPELALGYIEAWIEARPMEQDDLKALDTLINGPLEPLVRARLLRWLAAEDARLHRTAAHLISASGFGDSEPWEAPEEDLDALDLRDVLFSLHKLLAYAHGAGALVPALLSFLRRHGVETTLVEVVEEVLWDYVGEDYPSSTRRLLEERLEDGAAGVEAEVVQRVLASLEDVRARRRAQIVLPELQPPRRARELVRAKHEQTQEIMREVQRGMPLLGLMHRVTVMGGVRTVNEVLGGPPQGLAGDATVGGFQAPLPMVPFERTMELPRAEIADPVGRSMLRLRWRVLQREDIEREAL